MSGPWLHIMSRHFEGLLEISKTVRELEPVTEKGNRLLIQLDRNRRMTRHSTRPCLQWHRRQANTSRQSLWRPDN